MSTSNLFHSTLNTFGEEFLEVVLREILKYLVEYLFIVIIKLHIYCLLRMLYAKHSFMKQRCLCEDFEPSFSGNLSFEVLRIASVIATVAIY